MANKKHHEWEPPAWLKEPIASTAIFHDEEVDVYEGKCELENIRLWHGNYRTLLDLEHLKQLTLNIKTKTLNDDEIIDYVLKQGLHSIPDLADSIKTNGVRVPLIVSHKLELLDGNRRFMACRYLLKTEKERLPTFTTVPVKCTAPGITRDLKLKIIAEMNFLPEHKEEWPREVRATFALQQFEDALKRFKDEEKAYEHVEYFLRVNRSDLKRFQAVRRMINDYADFVEKEGKKARQEAERFGRAKFQFFEEFYNKALAGPRAIKDPNLIQESKELLYTHIRNQQLTSMMKVRDFAEIVRYEPSRKHLKKPDGTFRVAKLVYDDYVQSKEVSIKVIGFCEWLENLTSKEKAQIPQELRERLLKAAQKLKG